MTKFTYLVNGYKAIPENLMHKSEFRKAIKHQFNYDVYYTISYR